MNQKLGSSLGSPAHDARSVLACGLELTLTVGGVAIDIEEAPCTERGVPIFGVHESSSLVGAGIRGLTATLTVVSGLGSAGAPERNLRVTISGQLSSRGSEGCQCCDENTALVALQPSQVLLTGADQITRSVSLDDFADPRYVLNTGYLQRTSEHANQCHQGQLRAAVAAVLGVEQSELAAATLTDLTTTGVTVEWISLDGAHRQQLGFDREVSTPAELGRALRTHLNSDLC